MSDKADVIYGQVVEADFDPPDYPGYITILIRTTPDVRVGHWSVRMERLTEVPR